LVRDFTINPGEEGIFGYGSLLSQQSMERTLGRAYGLPPVVCSVSGWRRTWDVFVPEKEKWRNDDGLSPEKIVYLNVSRTPDELVNGLLYVIPSALLASFDAREWVYGRVDITSALMDVRVEGGRAWMYVAKPEFHVRGARFPEYGLRQTYLDVVEQGLATLGPEFRARYESSTDPPPSHLIFRDRRRV
jgi:cation transport regulator ChaC